MDHLYFFITAVAALCALVVVVVVTVLAIKYSDNAGDDGGSPIQGSLSLELGWSIVPVFTSMVILAWAAWRP